MTINESENVAAGEIFIARKRLTIKTVVTFGMTVCFYHSKKKFTALSHFLYVENPQGEAKNSVFGRASLSYLFKVLKEENVPFNEVEIHIYGGAIPEGVGEGFIETVKKNLNWTVNLLEKYGFKILFQDVGGHRARKILLDSDSGECIVAKVNQVRNSDWIMNQDSPVYRSVDESI